MRTRSLWLLLVPLLAGSCVKQYYPASATTTDSALAPTPVPVTHTIEFRVTGTVPLADVTFGSAQDGTTEMDTSVPWTSAFKTSRSTLFVYLKAASTFNGTITAQIFVDGALFREARSDNLGSTNVADVSGTVDLTP